MADDKRWKFHIVPLLYPNCQIQAFCTSMKLYELQLVRHYASRYTEYGLWGSRYLNRILKRILPQMARHKSLLAWLAVCSRYDPSVGLPTTQLKFKSTKAQIHGQKCSPEWRFLKTPTFRLRADERNSLVFEYDVMTSCASSRHRYF